MGRAGSVESNERAGRYTKKLTRAVVESVTENAPPPAELRLAWQCERWHVLPNEGGLYNQDYLTMHRMNTLSAVYNAIVKIKNLKGTQIHTLSDGERRILRMLMDNGFLFHA